MSKRQCCITGCSNGGYRLKIWRSKICFLHNSNYGKFPCICNPPFQLFPFPADIEERKKWSKAVNRKDIKSPNKIWEPNNDSRICSDHFVDACPTTANPYPTLSLGYEAKTITPRKPPKSRLFVTPDNTPQKKAKQEVTETINNEISAISQSPLAVCSELSESLPSTSSHSKSVPPVLLDHNYNYGDIINIESGCESCTSKDFVIKNLRMQVQKLTKEVTYFKNMYQSKVERPFGVECIKDDKMMKFYTGIPSKDAFFAIYACMNSSLPKVKYWRGCRTLCNPLRYKTNHLKKHGRKRHLSSKDELLLTLMKIRLGLLNQDLADRFGVSKQSVSNIFTTWVKVLDKFIGSLVFNPPKDMVRENLPPSFKNPTYSSVRHIIDCTEVFLETPQNLSVRADTWSDYKHHNTAKYLLSINPSGMFNYVSKGWGGRTSDKHITTHSGFLDLVEPYDKVLADRGFTITEDLVLRNAELLIPPGRRGAAQFSTAEVRKTKEIANRRIHIEQAIRRMKSFRILKYEVPITMLHHLDTIVRVVAGLCNLYPPLPKYK